MHASASNCCRRPLPATHRIGCDHLGSGTKASRARRHAPFSKSFVQPRIPARCALAAPFAADALGSSPTVYTLYEIPREPGSLVSPLTLARRGTRGSVQLSAGALADHLHMETPRTDQQEPRPTMQPGQSRSWRTFRGRGTRVIPNGLHVAEIPARTYKSGFTNAVRNSGAARSLPGTRDTPASQPDPMTPQTTTGHSNADTRNAAAPFAADALSSSQTVYTFSKYP